MYNKCIIIGSIDRSDVATKSMRGISLSLCLRTVWEHIS